MAQAILTQSLLCEIPPDDASGDYTILTSQPFHSCYSIAFDTYHRRRYRLHRKVELDQHEYRPFTQPETLLRNRGALAFNAVMGKILTFMALLVRDAAVEKRFAWLSAPQTPLL